MITSLCSRFWEISEMVAGFETAIYSTCLKSPDWVVIQTGFTHIYTGLKTLSLSELIILLDY
jgi:hypothetical protein